MRIRYRYTWRNTIKKFKVTPLKFFEPENLQDLISIVQEAEKNKVRVRAAGSGHSFSDVVISSGYLVDLKRLNRMLPLPPVFIKPKYQDLKLVQAEAGMTIQKFNKELDKKDLCVINMGGIDNQTLAGATSTGTHGTGIDLPAFHGMVRSVVMVVHSGKVMRIEPSDGISDPEKHRENGVELVQDDDLFNSVLVNLGCMGVIYSYIMEVLPMYWLAEIKRISTWEKVKPGLLDRSLFEDCRGLMVQMNPYAVKNNEHTCVVIHHRLLNTRPHRTISERFRNLRSEITGRIGISYYLVKFLMNTFPNRVPGLLDGALKSLKDRKYENKGYKVLYQGLEPIKRKAYDAEFAFPVQENMDGFVSSVDKILAVAEKVRKEHNLVQTSPLGIRFVKGAPVYLTPEYNRDIAYLDTPFVLKSKGADELLDIYQDIMLECDGIPHWGKINSRLNGRPDLIRKFYPKFENWQRNFLKLNPMGTFDSNFSDRMQFRPVVKAHAETAKAAKKDLAVSEK